MYFVLSFTVCVEQKRLEFLVCHFKWTEYSWFINVVNNSSRIKYKNASEM